MANGSGRDEVRQHTVGLDVENKPGVLARIAGLIAAKGYNIDSLTVGTTNDPTTSRMTIVLRGDEWVIEQACKQLNRLIDVIKVRDLTDEDRVERELILVRVACKRSERGEVFRIAEIFRASVVDVTPATFTLELTGAPSKVSAFLELLQPYQIQAFYRTGTIAMRRASKTDVRPRE